MTEFDRWAQQPQETIAEKAARLAREARANTQQTLAQDRTGFLNRDQIRNPLTPRGQDDNRDIDYDRRYTQDNNRSNDYDRRFAQDNSRDIDYDRRYAQENTRNNGYNRRFTQGNTRDIDYDQRYAQDANRDIDYDRRYAQDSRNGDYDRRYTQDGTRNNDYDRRSTDNNNFRVRPVDTEQLARQRRDEVAQNTLSSEQQILDNMKFQAEQLKKQRVLQEIEDTQEEIASELHRKEMQAAVRRKREFDRDRWAMVPGNTGYGFTDDQRPLIDYPSTNYPDRRLQDFVDPMDDLDADYDRVAQRTTGTRQPRPSGAVPASIGGPVQQVAARINNATTRTNTRGNDVVLADQTQLTRLNQQNKLLWFMMLCSLGLNIYLGWIARSFYGRYEELADELRETFTTTVT